MQVQQTSIIPSDLHLHPAKNNQCRCSKRALLLPACTCSRLKVYNADATDKHPPFRFAPASRKKYTMRMQQASITPSDLLLHPAKTIQCRCSKQASPLPACTCIQPKVCNAGAKPPRAGQNLFLDFEPEVIIISRRRFTLAASAAKALTYTQTSFLPFYSINQKSRSRTF